MKTIASAAVMAAGSIVACSSDSETPPVADIPVVATPTPTSTAPAATTPAPVEKPPVDVTAQLKARVKHVIVVFAENRGFDNIYGRFPGANGLANANAIQKDRDGSVLSKLPQTWGGVTPAGITPVVTQAMSDGLANAPYAIEATYSGVDATTITRDLYHRFFENQMQIDGGKERPIRRVCRLRRPRHGQLRRKQNGDVGHREESTSSPTPFSWVRSAARS